MKQSDFILCEHIASLQKEGKDLNLGNAFVVIDTGGKRLALCRACDNLLRGHYIAELENIIIKVASK